MKAKRMKSLLGITVAVSMTLTGCQSPNGGGQSGETSYLASCVVTGAVAAVITNLVAKHNSGKKASKESLAKAAAGGCAVGVAVTAVAKVMDDRQKARYEEAMQREAARLAQSQQQQAATEARIQNMPAGNARQRANKDAALESARRDWQTSYAKPVVVDIGNGGTTTITPQPPAQLPATGQGGCVDLPHQVKTNAGTVKQYDTWCPNKSGQMVRTQSSNTEG